MPLIVYLAAGRSSRMGSDKARLALGGEPLLLAHLRAARRAGLLPRVVLARPWPEGLPAEVCYNPDGSSMYSSLQCALRAGVPPTGLLVSPVDVPPVWPSTVEGLFGALDEDAVPVDARGQPGHPVYLAASTARRALEVTPDGGLRDLLRGARRVPVEQPDVATDFDTPRAWKDWLDQPIQHPSDEGRGNG